MQCSSPLFLCSKLFRSVPSLPTGNRLYVVVVEPAIHCRRSGAPVEVRRKLGKAGVIFDIAPVSPFTT